VAPSQGAKVPVPTRTFGVAAAFASTLALPSFSPCCSDPKSIVVTELGKQKKKGEKKAASPKPTAP
jgi:hypothetical protein